ncbi:DUF1517 domain-containing protein [Anthocerotibacter panamensis]|uniref:DUF1517 domain-containing protein n=1 Tax=Anthocerotibacter panamensis TaxID=2857077 RepID=UPI001C408CB6|nr:DUF1517 domain-containing protein [Anthocerotibacter panamensis]
MFHWIKSKRYVVTTIMVGLNGLTAAPLLGALNRSTREIIASDGDFEVASAEIAKVAGGLLDYESAWTHSANWGEVFTKEVEAGDYGAECFAQNSQRYLSSGEGLQEAPVAVPTRARSPQNIVVMLTVAYQGELAELETALTSVDAVRRALAALVVLHNKDQLQLAHLHYAPAHFGDDLDTDQLLVNYPELVAL